MKLGLIAMSGIRVQDAELMRLGLTLPGVVERSQVIASLPSLGLLTLAGLTPPAIDMSYVELPGLDEAATLPAEFDAVAISSFTARIKDAYRLADRYRQAGTKVILGGLHVTALPGEAMEHADAIMLGEAESVWPRLLHDLERGALQQVYDARQVSYDLAQSPMPRFDLIDPAGYNRLTVQSQRGCPFSCEFCASSIRLAPEFKVKPVDRVIAEIRAIKDIWQNPFIEFADDNTFASKAHGKRLARALARENVRWFTETDISVADDEELLSLMADAGCAQLLIGLEAPGLRGLEDLETKCNWKAKRASSYLDAVRRIQRHGITVNGCFILGLDGQTAESFDDIIAFVRESGLYEVQVTLQTPFPGTPLYSRLEADNRLLKNGAWEDCTLFDVTFKPQNMSAAELRQRFHTLVKDLYAEEFVRWRRSGFVREQKGIRGPGG